MEPLTLNITLNGQPRALRTDPRRPLLDVLREDCALTGAKYGCGAGDCGACSALVDGKRIFSCITPAAEVAGKSITTVEGLAKGQDLHPVQQAFLDEHAFQCGYCTSGMIIATVSTLNQTPRPTEDDLLKGINGNLCRCCSYQNIRRALHRAAGLPQPDDRHANRE